MFGNFAKGLIRQKCQKWRIFESTWKGSKVDKFHSYDGIIRIKWLYNHPRVNLCEKGEENGANFRKIRRCLKVTKTAIFRNFANGLIRQKCQKWPIFGVNLERLKSW